MATTTISPAIAFVFGLVSIASLPPRVASAAQTPPAASEAPSDAQLQAAPAPAATPAPAVTPAPAATEPLPVITAPIAPASPSNAGIPESVASDGTIDDGPAQSPRSGYNHGFYIEDDSGENRIRLNGRVQTLFSTTANAPKDIDTSFSVHRARLTLSGHVISPSVQYKFQAAFDRGAASLKDAYLDLRPGHANFSVRVGQTKRPYSRQFLASSQHLSQVERAITHDAFDAGRDIGVMVHNNFERSPRIEWAVGVFNGTGSEPQFTGSVPLVAEDPENPPEELPVEDGTFDNVPLKLHPMAVARAGFNHGDVNGYVESDLKGGPLRFGVAVSAMMDFDRDRTRDVGTRAQFDFILKAHGFSTNHAMYIATDQRTVSPNKTVPWYQQELNRFGFHSQVGYTYNKRLHPSVRYAFINHRQSGFTVQNDHEILAGVTAYFADSRLQLRTDAGTHLSQLDIQTAVFDLRLRTMLELAF